MWSSLIVFVVFVAGFVIGAGAGARRIGRLMRTPKFWKALPDHILLEIRFRCVRELEERRGGSRDDAGAGVSGEENTAEPCGVPAGEHEWADADAYVREKE